MAGDQDMLDSPDGLNDAERAEFAAMEGATSGGSPVDPGAADAGGAAEGAAGGADDAAAAAAAAAAGGEGAGAEGAAGAADPAVAAAAAAAAGAADDAEDDDDDEPAAPVLGADGKPEPRRKARVSAKKYNAEKERADKLDSDLRTTREQMARADERMRLINEALTTPRVDPNAKKPGEEEDAEPDPEADAFGWMKWSRNKTAQLEKSIKEIREGKQTEDGQRVVANAYTEDAKAFATKEPNFVPAYRHLMASRTQELAMYFCGVDLTDPQARKLTPQEVQRITSVAADEERGIVEQAISQNRSPAQAVYQMARFRGFRPQTAAERDAAAAAAAANGGAKPGNGAAKPATNGKAADTGGKVGSVSDEIERIKAGVDASVSLSDGGASPSNPLTAQRLADMPEAQFNELMDKLDGTDPEAFRRLMEGTP